MHASKQCVCIYTHEQKTPGDMSIRQIFSKEVRDIQG